MAAAMSQERSPSGELDRLSAALWFSHPNAGVRGSRRKSPSTCCWRVATSLTRPRRRGYCWRWALLSER